MMEWALMISFDNGLSINIDIQDVNLNIFCTCTKIILLDLLQNSDIQAHLAIDVHVWSCDL